MNIYEFIKGASNKKEVSLKESEIKVGDTFKNKEGAIIKVVEPTKEGRPQFNIASSKEDFSNGKVECRDTDCYDSLNKILSDNGYEKLTESTGSWEKYQSQVENTLENAKEELESNEFDAFCEGVINLAQNYLGELDQMNETESDSFETKVYKDFQTFLDDNNITEPTEDDINNYFTGMFYDIETEEDLDDSNRAEELIRSKYLGESCLKEGTNLRGSVYTEIVRSIDDACAEEMDTEEIRKFLQELMGYIRGTAESYNVMVESTAVEETYNFSQEVRDIIDNYKGESTEDYLNALNAISELENKNVIGKDEYEKAIKYIQDSLKLRESEYSTFLEAANPDNAEANDLIKKALSDAMFAYKHQDELKELGITVDYDIWHGEEPKNAGSFSKCNLVGANGRTLKCNTNEWRNEMPESRDITRVSNSYSNDEEENTVAQKSYKDSKEKVKIAKEELPTLKRRLNLYERRYGKDSRQYRELVDYIKQTEKTIEKGIQARKKTDYGQKPNENVDFKNYLDQKKMTDREKPYEAPKVNPTIAKYKDAKFEEQYNKDWEARNKKYDEEDAQRIADYARRAAEDKSRRDSQLNDAKARTKETLDALRARVEASKARRGVK